MLKKCDRDPVKFEKELPSRLLSVTCVVIGFIHFANSAWKADWILVAFVALCFAPWLGYVFESIGKEGAKYRNTKSGESTSPPDTGTTVAAQAAPQQTTFDAMAYDEKKIISTLWRYQKRHFPDQKEARWTFVVQIGSPDYMGFSYGFLELVKKGFASVAANGQIMLSQSGYLFCEANDAPLSRWTDTYDRFSS
jgi:hypothetical protein